MYSKTRKESQVAIVSRDPSDYYYDYELGESSGSSKEGSIHDLAIDYHRSSTSSSSDGSGKHLVRTYNPSSNARKFDRIYNLREERFYDKENNRRGSVNTSSGTPSPDLETKSTPNKFYVVTPSPKNSSEYPPSNGPMHHLAVPIESNRRRNPVIYPYSLQIHPSHLLAAPKPHDRKDSAYDSYWTTQPPRAWCGYEECLDENRRCAECQLKEESGSTCSSVNPPPTFTAMDNYRPVRKKSRKCSCGAVSAVTTAFSTLILLLIAAFILYTEMVLKKTSYVPEPM